ncbi:Diamine acetyltransferase 2 [Hondaea fermentalgiana]|uniref:Diamine acetyltransferase 2 n=1 Tax=Hondaea fermentalgiana TaxID=2315210 RepID=A0A2R5G1P3_9STRA|nr:Diamine acetyltransferase 2 [Hondaea fermentalgiana]|eukprot:GBG24912.1 Diamine acetyltransferase 2 [Hondaea fermentalgiana]
MSSDEAKTTSGEAEDGYVLRRATLEDVETLVTFNNDSAIETENRQLDRDKIRRGLEGIIGDTSGARGFYLVVEKENMVVACSMVTFEWSEWNAANYWWIQSVYVHKDHRRRGLFKRLYAKIYALAKEDKAAAVRLYVEHDNERAKSTYVAMGMQPSHYLMYEVDLPDATAE